MNAFEIAKEILPSDFSDDQIENVIWSCTGYPSFWPNRNITPEANFRNQLQAAADAYAEGRDPVDESYQEMNKIHREFKEKQKDAE